MEKWICNKIGLKSQGWEAVVSVGLDGQECGWRDDEGRGDKRQMLFPAGIQSIHVHVQSTKPIIFYQTGIDEKICSAFLYSVIHHLYKG
jgi:hypothetical protein